MILKLIFYKQNCILEIYMDNWTFGVTMIIVGMGGTLAVLALFAVFMVLLKKIFPLREENAEKSA